MQLFTFIYSKRTGTPAAKCPTPRPTPRKAARMDRLLKTQEEFAFAATAAMAGQTVRVLVESRRPQRGYRQWPPGQQPGGRVPAAEPLIGQWANVHLTGSRAACWCELELPGSRQRSIYIIS